jgi:hypothetical protein
MVGAQAWAPTTEHYFHTPVHARSAPFQLKKKKSDMAEKVTLADLEWVARQLHQDLRIGASTLSS